MATVQYLDIAGLKIYDGLIKGVISKSEAKALKTVKISGQTLNFYKAETPASDATPDFTITLPKQDLSNLLEKINGGVVGNVVTIGADGIVVDSGIKATDIATSTDVSTAKSEVEAEIGSLENLTTTAKDNVVSAVNEVKGAVDNIKTDSAVTITTDTTSEGAAKSYTVKQGTTQIAVIDIPKDMVVSSGTVETYTADTLPTGEGAPTTPGTYIVLTIANKEASKLYIPADKLVDIYTAEKNAAQIQLSISADNVISALIVAGSVGTAEIADSAITTAKIADKNVTLAKLSDTVQTSLGLADSAVQESDITELRATAASAVQPGDIEVIPEDDITGLFE
jgi:hypothetical protein